MRSQKHPNPPPFIFLGRRLPAECLKSSLTLPYLSSQACPKPIQTVAKTVHSIPNIKHSCIAIYHTYILPGCMHCSFFFETKPSLGTFSLGKIWGICIKYIVYTYYFPAALIRLLGSPSNIKHRNAILLH